MRATRIWHYSGTRRRGNDEDDDDADWEEEISAGDDITVKRLARVKVHQVITVTVEPGGE
jgi:hypothetical protein